MIFERQGLHFMLTGSPVISSSFCGDPNKRSLLFKQKATCCSRAYFRKDGAIIYVVQTAEKQSHFPCTLNGIAAAAFGQSNIYLNLKNNGQNYSA